MATQPLKRAVVAVLLVALLPASAAAKDTYPVMHVGGDDRLGAPADTYFDLYGLATAPAAAVVTIQSPAGYGASLVHRPQFILGDAEVDTSRGAYKGEFAVASREAFKADPATARCADGPHAATWWMVLNGTHGELSVPVAVDRHAQGFRLICQGASPAPAGCASESTDGILGAETKVKVADASPTSA